MDLYKSMAEMNSSVRKGMLKPKNTVGPEKKKKDIN